MGLVALQHVGSSQTRDQTRVSCISRQILYHWATWEALPPSLLSLFLLLSFLLPFPLFFLLFLLFSPLYLLYFSPSPFCCYFSLKSSWTLCTGGRWGVTKTICLSTLLLSSYPQFSQLHIYSPVQIDWAEEMPPGKNFKDRTTVPG